MRRHLLAAAVGLAFPLIGAVVVAAVAAAGISAERFHRLGDHPPG